MSLQINEMDFIKMEKLTNFHKLLTLETRLSKKYYCEDIFIFQKSIDLKHQIIIKKSQNDQIFRFFPELLTEGIIVN